MQNYVVRRLLFVVPTILGVTLIVFLVMRLLPGDPTSVIFGEEGFRRLSEVERQSIRDSLGLNEPLYQQYFSWLKDIATLKLGESFWRGDRIVDTVLRRGFISGEIAVLALIFSWLIGLPAGILGALKQNSAADYSARVLTILFLAVPHFWLGSVIVLILLLYFDWLAPPGVIHPWDNFVENVQIVVLPALVLGITQAALIARMARSTLLEVIREDYVRTARAKGLKAQAVIIRHALPNALLPVVTLSGALMGYLLGGSVVVEQAFGVSGLGGTLVAAISERDLIVIQNLVLVYALIFVFINLFVDLAYVWIDPRIRYR